jgi:hypothetical protein
MSGHGMVQSSKRKEQGHSGSPSGNGAWCPGEPLLKPSFQILRSVSLCVKGQLMLMR